MDNALISTGNAIHGDLNLFTLPEKKLKSCQKLKYRTEEKRNKGFVYFLLTVEVEWSFDADKKLRQDMCVHVCTPHNILARRS